LKINCNLILPTSDQKVKSGEEKDVLEDCVPTDPTFSVFGTAVGTILQIQPGLYGYETPIQTI